MSDFSGVQFTDRYEALGIQRPSLLTICRGQCEGVGFAPVFIDTPAAAERRGPDGVRSQDEADPELVALWREAEAASPSDDGWHFVTCPQCKGTGKRQGRFPKLRNLPNDLYSRWRFFRSCILNMDCRVEPQARWSRLKHLKLALPILFKL
ncbi:hypothetical protein [Streptomyces microflavus]|uniref:hypothetical protein n=1 Tax=Streptomyces microflavus TaxID=1919 RepID=UPI002E3112CD|nr:hypothetical protein [Streptomyces microflavus]